MQRSRDAHRTHNWRRRLPSPSGQYGFISHVISILYLTCVRHARLRSVPQRAPSLSCVDCTSARTLGRPEGRPRLDGFLDSEVFSRLCIWCGVALVRLSRYKSSVQFSSVFSIQYFHMIVQTSGETRLLHCYTATALCTLAAALSIAGQLPQSAP